MMAAFLARDMADGEEIFVGTNLPVIRAAALLAHLHHGPNMRVMVAHTRTNLFRTPVMEHFEVLTDWRAGRWAEAYFNDNEIVVFQKSRRDSVFFVGALQIDSHGNSNLIGLRSDTGRGFRMRGPGAIATTTNASHVRALLSLRQRALAARVRGALRLREHRRLGSGGRRRAPAARAARGRPALLRDAARDPRLRGGLQAAAAALGAPGRDASDQVVARYRVPPDHSRPRAGRHRPPTADELDILRRRVDPQGLLRR